MYIFSLLLIVFQLSLLGSEETQWRQEPYALLLVQKARDSNRLEEKKNYLERIALRLGLTLPQNTYLPENIDQTVERLYALFYPTEVQYSPVELLAQLKPLFPLPSPKRDDEEIHIVRELQELDKTLAPSTQANWEWIQLQLDAMALDLLPLIQNLNSTDDTIEAINWYLFFLKEVRYPPLKEAFQRVDHYSSLGSTLSSQQGICLGTTILYAALCQRLGISLTIFTPPGHIFPAIKQASGFRAIETTARGSHVPLSQYETIDEPILKPHSLSVIITSYLENKAADLLMRKDFQKALDLYLRCDKISPEGPHTKLIALCYLMLNKPSDASRYAKEALKKEKSPDCLLADIAEGRLSAQAAESLFTSISEENPFLSQKALPGLLQAVEKSKDSLALRFQAAILLFQDHRAKEARALLNEAPMQPKESLHWLLLRVSIASYLNDSAEELTSATELLKLSLTKKIFSSDLVETCSSLYRKNPDCQELSGLLQRVFEEQKNAIL